MFAECLSGTKAPARDDVLEQQGQVDAVERRPRADDHPLDVLLEAELEERLEHHLRHEPAAHGVGQRETRRFRQLAALQPGRQVDRVLERERAELVDLQPDGGERRAIEAVLGQQHRVAGLGVGRLRRGQAATQFGKVTRIGLVADGHGLEEIVLRFHPPDLEGETLGADADRSVVVERSRRTSRETGSVGTWSRNARACGTDRWFDSQRRKAEW